MLNRIPCWKGCLFWTAICTFIHLNQVMKIWTVCLTVWTSEYMDNKCARDPGTLQCLKGRGGESVFEGQCDKCLCRIQVPFVLSMQKEMHWVSFLWDVFQVFMESCYAQSACHVELFSYWCLLIWRARSQFPSVQLIPIAKEIWKEKEEPFIFKQE